MAGHTSFVRREPIGVCAQVTPWNYPMMMAVWKWAPAIAAGNTVVLKPSDTTPVSTLGWRAAGRVPPSGRLQRHRRRSSTGAELVSHPIPNMASITGSVRAGMEVAKRCGLDLKRVHLELGGKAPVIVFDDADLAAAAEAIAVAGYFNAGQDCTAATRVLWRARRSTTTSLRSSRSRRRTPRPATPTTRTSSTAPSTTRTSSSA
jgi:betaine-aldehyde dehydrogenase